MSRVVSNNLNNSSTLNKNITGPSSIQRLKGQLGANSRVGTANGVVSRVLGWLVLVFCTLGSFFYI